MARLGAVDALKGTSDWGAGGSTDLPDPPEAQLRNESAERPWRLFPAQGPPASVWKVLNSPSMGT